MQYLKRYQTVTVVCIIVVLFVVAVLLFFIPSEETGFFRKVTLDVVAPGEGVIGSAFQEVENTWKRYIFLVGLEEENRELRQRVAALSGEVNASREMLLECVRLRSLLGLKNSMDLPTVAARVVGRNRAFLFKSFVIDKGTADGVKVGFPVVVAGGVVGRIIEASWNTSKVLLIVDYNSRIDAFVQKSRIRGILEGCRDLTCVLKYVPRTEEVSVGEPVVSSGLAGVYPKGLLLGRIEEVKKEEAGLFQEIKVSPIVNVEKIEEVIVIVGKDEEETK